MSRLPLAHTASAADVSMSSLHFLPLAIALCFAVLALLLPWSPFGTPILDAVCIAALIIQQAVWSR